MERIVRWWPEEVTKTILGRAGDPDPIRQGPASSASAVAHIQQARCEGNRAVGVVQTSVGVQDNAGGAPENPGDDSGDNTSGTESESESEPESESAANNNHDSDLDDNNDRSGSEGSDRDSDDGSNDDEEPLAAESPIVSNRLALGDPYTPSPPRREVGRRRANSIDGIFVLADDDPRITPARIVTDLPSIFPFPSYAISGTGKLYDQSAHTVAFQVVEPTEAVEVPDADLGGMILAIDDGDVSNPTTPLEGPTTPREAAPPVTSLSLKRPAAPGTENPAPKRVPSISSSSGSLARLTSETLSRYHRALAAPVASPPTPDTAALAPPAPPPALDTSLPGVNYDGLDALEIEVIQSSDSSLEDSVGICLDLLRDFLDPERMVDGLELLSSMGGVSSIGGFEMSIVSVAQEGMSPNPFSTSVDPMVNSDVFDRMINASRHAQSQISHSERAIAVLRIRTIMSYITLFLTLEHAVISRTKREHPETFPGEINAMKLKYFHQLLALLILTLNPDAQ